MQNYSDNSVTANSSLLSPSGGVKSILSFHHVSCARCNLAVSFGLCGTVPFSLVSSACVVKCKTRLFCWTQTEPESISPIQQRTPRTVLITENGMKSTKVFHSSTVFKTLNRSMKSHLFDGALNVHHLRWESLQSGQPLRWKTSKAMRCWTLEHPDQLEVT